MNRKSEIIEREPLALTEVDASCGLSEEQIAERTQKGHINNVNIRTSKSVFNIIVSNTCTFFNLLCVLIFAWILSVADSLNDIKNCTFLLIILINTGIGIFQEVRAKKTMDRLSLLTSPKVKVLRGGNEREIAVNEVLRGDILLPSAGNQICSDAEILEGDVEVNESMLTGESKPQKRGVGDKLLSGSYIVSGTCRAKVVNVAEENYIQRLAMEAKKYKPQTSELIRSLKFIMKIIGIIILIIMIPAFLNNFSAQLALLGKDTGTGLFAPLFHLNLFTGKEIYQAYRLAVVPTSGGLIGMIPAGLFLMASVALYVGVNRLGKRKALVQGLYSIETLARVNMLCLDKTGTITDGTMKVVAVLPVGKVGEERIKDIVASMQQELLDANQTAIALREYFGYEGPFRKEFALPFSSDRKCSMVKFLDEKMYLLGAPEFVRCPIDAKLKESIDGYLKQGCRCLLLAENAAKVQGKDLPERTAPLALIVIEDNIKSEAAATIQYFKDNGVDVRVISGDNPVTVSQIAKRVGIENADRYLSLQDMPDEELKAVALKYTVFGRVNPEQKKLLIQIFKAAGHTVAMTGDGINDILALKEADCSVAMANGSEATRNVAQLVLMDSNFASMPYVVGEGRRVVNNIERASTLFLMKTMFSFLLSFILIFMQKPYPLEPIQISFISIFTIGAPALFLAFEPNNKRIEGNFLANIAKRVLPGALAIVLNVVLIMLLSPQYWGLVQMTQAQSQTMIMVSIYTVFLIVLYDICKPFTPLRIVLFAAVLTASLTIIVVSPLLPYDYLNLFNIASLLDVNLVTLLVTLLCLSYFIIKLSRYAIRKFTEIRWKFWQPPSSFPPPPQPLQ